MKFYYLSATPNEEGEFEIHHRECSKIPLFHNRLYLGPFNNSYEAINQSLKSNPKSVICNSCQTASMIPRFSQFSDSESRLSNP
jgi:hypothetical protein